MLAFLFSYISNIKSVFARRIDSHQYERVRDAGAHAGDSGCEPAQTSRLLIIQLVWKPLLSKHKLLHRKSYNYLLSESPRSKMNIKLKADKNTKKISVSPRGQRNLIKVAMHDGISRALMKKAFISKPGKAPCENSWTALWFICLDLALFFFLPRWIVAFRRHRWSACNRSDNQERFQARSCRKEHEIMSSNRRTSFPNALRRSPRRRTKTPSVNELSKKCSK